MRVCVCVCVSAHPTQCVVWTRIVGLCFGKQQVLVLSIDAAVWKQADLVCDCAAPSVAASTSIVVAPLLAQRSLSHSLPLVSVVQPPHYVAATPIDTTNELGWWLLGPRFGLAS